ncbi:hypothetical protein [Shewanella colwelliana]|uniref:hypothetical protein n=1 Tax=Shewanella colwelliana TaxID=23 RepID=UPI001586ADBB|nr:hypothetical protein [Shewanella colwelliana]
MLLTISVASIDSFSVIEEVIEGGCLRILADRYGDEYMHKPAHLFVEYSYEFPPKKD